MISNREVYSRALHAMALFVLVLCLGGCGEKSVEQLVEEAKQERDNGHYRSAIVHLKGALQQAPDHPEARYLLGASYSDLGDFYAAETELRRAIDLGHERAKVTIANPLLMTGKFQQVLDELPANSDADNAMQAEILTLRARASLGLGRRQEGRDLLDRALMKQPEYSDALVVKARLAARDDQVDEAGRLLDRALASAPKNVDAWMMKGDLARTKADRAGALAAYGKVLEISPEYLAARLNIAEIQVDARNFDDARKSIEQVRNVSPSNLQARYLLALIEFRQRRYSASRDAVLQVLKVAPNHHPSVMLAGTLEYTLGSHAQAQKYLSRIVEVAPGYLYARKLLVSSLARSGQIERAIELLQPGLEQAPNDSALAALAGEVYLQTNEPAKAARYFEKAVKLDPKGPMAHIGLGRTRLALGETERALSDLEAAQQLETDEIQADILLVMVHQRRGHYDKALQVMQTLEKKQPNNPWIHNLKAAIYGSKGDEAAARKSLERALELNPSYVPAAVNLAQFDLRHKKTTEARRRLESILEREKNNTEALLALARLAPRLGATTREQIEWLERARTANPELVQPQLMLARIHAFAGDSRKALDVTQRLAVEHPTNLEVLDALGGFQVLTGSKEQAVATFKKLATLQPRSPAILVRLAMAQAANGEQSRAMDSLRKAVSIQPDFIDAHVALANFEANAGRYSAAIKIAHDVQKTAPGSPVGFVLEGDVLMAEKKFPQAVKAYEAAYGIEKSGPTLSKIHTALRKAGKSEEAQARLQQAIKEAPDDSLLRMYAAESSLQSGNYRNAIEHYEWLLKKHPDNVMFLNNMAMAYHRSKEPRALQTAERAYQLRPDNPAIADTLGLILVEQGNVRRGIEILQKAVKAAPKNTEIRYHYGQALIKTGDHARARQELEKLLADAPESPQAKDARQLLSSLN